MQGQRPVERRDSTSHELLDARPSITSNDPSRGRVGWLASPVVAIVAVVCCAGPLLFVALAANGAGAWLAVHGYTLGAVALVVVGSVFAWRIRIGTRTGN